ncbi:acetoin utilization protein [Candidatus Acidianus copahuensis]|uniref:Acetoin utilization protein n=1 Tax=Candidatus Acidianus copahuensis TaxID=1160895 RepID=A0A031LRI4_9CREN|nr:histone deacetylase family protein [Candidatus Acidianus copahuensis]EZQ07024.1 acetoin utilization protein [Candidatus Acidianus copahuensis]
MSGELLGVIWDERFNKISFSHPMIRDISMQRIKKFKEMLDNVPRIIIIKPEEANEDDILEVHTVSYVEKLKEVSNEEFIGFLDGGDTVHYPGMFSDILLVLGSTFTGIKYLKFLEKVYIPLGGFHHSLPDRAMGFCPINDVALGVKTLLKEGKRVAIIDVDAHHGNGLQEILYRDPVLKVNIFGYDGKFFPGTGRLEERGEGKGRCLNFNVGLPLDSGDDSFEYALRMLDLVYEYSPEYLVVIAGVDGHRNDNLKSLNLTTNSYLNLGIRVERLRKRLNAKVLSYGGGGYGPYSSLCMISFLYGLQGVNKRDEKPTQSKNEDIKKTKDVVKTLFFEGFTHCL